MRPDRILILAVLCACASSWPARTVQPGDRSAGFEAQASYANAEGLEAGTRWTHIPTGIAIDLLYGAPRLQGFVSFRTVPASENGEARAAADFVLCPESAEPGCAPAGWRCSALVGLSHTLFVFDDPPADCVHPVPTPLIERAILAEPTNSDLRREAWQIRVEEDQGILRLAEGGRLWRELQRSARDPRAVVWEKLIELEYGPDHPLSNPVNGTLSGVRNLTLERARDFMRDFYFPDRRMGIVLFVPSAADSDVLLAELDRILRRLRAARDSIDAQTPAAALRRSPAEIPDYSSRSGAPVYLFPFTPDSTQGGGLAVFSWPPATNPTPSERLLLRLLWSVVQDDVNKSGPSLYDPSVWRRFEFEASTLPGSPPFIWVTPAGPDVLRPDSLLALRRRLHARLIHIVELAPDAPQFIAVRAAARADLENLRVSLARESASPGFASVSAAESWHVRLRDLAREPGFAKDLSAGAVFARADSLLSGGNPWPRLVDRWQLDREPYVVGAQPDSGQSAEVAADDRARLDSIVQAICEHFGVTDPQEALRLFRESQTDLAKPAGMR